MPNDADARRERVRNLRTKGLLLAEQAAAILTTQPDRGMQTLFEAMAYGSAASAAIAAADVLETKL